MLPREMYFGPTNRPEVEVVELTFDELEALRLSDLLGLYQEEAAKLMKVSRATFGRIVEMARKKVADALVNGKAIRIVTGSVELMPSNLESVEYCICPNCGFKMVHPPHIPCRSLNCPTCGHHLIRIF